MKKCPCSFFMSLGILKSGLDHAVFFAAFTFAQRARCAAAIFLRAAADIVRLRGIVAALLLSFLALTFAQR
jgi:hypothetical protein